MPSSKEEMQEQQKQLAPGHERLPQRWRWHARAPWEILFLELRNAASTRMANVAGWNYHTSRIVLAHNFALNDRPEGDQDGARPTPERTGRSGIVRCQYTAEDGEVYPPPAYKRVNTSAIAWLTTMQQSGALLGHMKEKWPTLQTEH